MNEAIKKLQELYVRMEKITDYDEVTLIDVKNKLNLYIQKFFNSKVEYLDILKKISSDAGTLYVFNKSVAEFKSLITTLIQDIELSQKEFDSSTESEKERINKIRREVEHEQEKIQINANEIRLMREQLERERENLLFEEAKFNEFKTKLELADKKIDFQFQADNNKKKAMLWAIAAGIFISTLVVILCVSLNNKDGFLSISEYVKGKMVISRVLKADNLIDNTIYFTYAKYIFTKLMLYSLLLYAIGFCVKNYNAQMHNHIVNSHKSNAFKSTISLLNTAKSEDGNDKLLVQATQAIFAHQQTGYNGKGTEQPSPNLVTNVIDGALKKV